ncbi:hypothetical protein FCL47_23460 [Desulfopila sp. IMCC35006]|uniref:hypothetical protein n=1 Tax=Desulfopila sp. IMCC35006 TaxID=2569542 RepID=UPI0010AD25F9|nr:hypothetical protein [Desulfopila sp. IMCC35006]TKB23234.1 hypothetical protein FCL47_23460 [Desulfopila sp. IMCC35006]
MKTRMKKRYVLVPAVILALLLLGKTFFPYLVWLPAMNVTQTLLGWWPASWKEEVLLHDGGKIIVKRSQTRGGRHEIGQDVPVNKHTLSVVLPESGKKITWQTTIGPDLEDTELQPLALDIISGIPYLVTTPMGCIAYNKWKRPNPPYVFLKYSDNDWQQIPVDELPLQITKANMVISGFQLRRERLLSHRFGVVPAEEITRINEESKHKEVQYLKVFVREPLDASFIENLCEKRVLYKGSWILPNDIIGQKFIDKQKK